MKKIFAFPEPFTERAKIFPVFLPFQGCPNKCVYCAQDLQTGSKPGSLQSHYNWLENKLNQALTIGQGPFEIGFYGGTFTALGPKWSRNFIRLAQYYRQKGLITRIRCSTRPDFIAGSDLKELKKAGLDLVELGIQSFCDHVLSASKRGYSSSQARSASLKVIKCGLELGIQLLPGLPLHSPEDWLEDIALVRELRPHIVRIYPCLVLTGTELERWWNQGHYLPWGLDKTVRLISKGVLKLWRSNIPVIRMGLPPEGDLISQIKAGPWHPGFGSMVRSRVLFYFLLTHLLIFGRPEKLYCPGRYQGDLWGINGINKERLLKWDLSKEKVIFWQQNYFMLEKHG